MNLFTLSPRSLGIFRILIGFALLIDSLNKAMWARDFLSDWGLVPRTVWISEFMPAWKFSIHLASGETWFQITLILFQAMAAVAMMVGWRTRTAQLIAFILLCSLQSRNNIILSAADDLLRLSLFWSLFLPLNQAFAVEKDLQSTSGKITTFAGVAFITQLFLMYIVTGLLKHHPIWLEEGSAIYYALHIDMYMKPAGIFLRDYHELTRVLTWLTLALEIFGPFLIFAGSRLRATAIVLFIGFHLGLALTMTLGLFPWIAIIYWIALIPDCFWSTATGLKLTRILDRLISHARTVTAKIHPKEPATKSSFKLTLAGQFFLLMCFGLMVWINLASLSKKVPFPESVKATTYYLYLNQHWNMFAPYPIKNDGWFVIEGSFKDGSVKELQTNQNVTFDKPALSSSFYANSEWRKWMLNVWDRGNRKILLPYARYLCRKFSSNEPGNSDLATIKINFMKETTPPMGKSFTPVEQRVLWEHDCFAK